MRKTAWVDTMRNMIRDIKIWRLVRYVYRKELKKSTYLSREEVLESIMNGESPAIGKKWLIEHYAKRHLTNMERIAVLLEDAKKRNYIEEVNYELGAVIKTTTEGNDIVGHIPFTNYLLKKYDAWWLWVCFPIIGFLVGKYWDSIINLFK